MTTVLPEPDGPMTEKLPRSPWWKLKKNGVALVVASKVTASPQWLPLACPMAKPCRLPKHAMLALEISARRTTKCSLPGIWPQKHGSRLPSSRTATAPDIGQRRSADRRHVIKLSQRGAAHQHAKVMVAKADRAGAQRIARRRHFAAFGHRLLIGRAQAADRQVDPLARNLAVGRGICLGQHQFARQTQQRIGQAGRGGVGIFLETTRSRRKTEPLAPLSSSASSPKLTRR